jgi:hypothetical protein
MASCNTVRQDKVGIIHRITCYRKYNYVYCKKYNHVCELVRLQLRVYWSRNLLLCKRFCKEMYNYNYRRLKLFTALI